LPLDYSRRSAGKLDVAVIRLPATDPAQRIGPLFLNFGGPGGPTTEILRAIGPEYWAELNQRFDIVGIDPRGTGATQGAMDCRLNQETEGLYSGPFTTLETLDRNALVERARTLVRRCLERIDRRLARYATTANTARDMDRIRAALGEAKLSYLGFSYGSFLGQTYATLFPNRYRAMVLDGVLDPDQYINRPTEGLRAQSAGFEVALGRFFQACAAHKDVCPFDADDPWMAFDELVERASVTPLPSTGERTEPVDAADLLFTTTGLLYAKQLWPLLATALDQAEAGDGTLFRTLTDAVYGRQEDGTYDPITDRYFLLGAIEQRYTRNLDFYLRAGREAQDLFPHAYWNTGYVELAYGLFPINPRGAFYGPFRASSDAPTILVVSTTYDPATPHRGAIRAVRQLGNARLLTMRGDGHTAYGNGGNNSACIDERVNRYLIDVVLPAEGTVCRQDMPFAQPEATAAATADLDSLTFRMPFIVNR
jgi:pimeloyl-ACP methyl ester carboxylesterase